MARVIGAPPGADYREVAFDASDGVDLSGWYRPTRNGATILVVHGGGGDRTRRGRARRSCSSATATASCSTTPAAAGRARASRTPGAGAGTKDVAGALAFLKARPEVDPERIGGLGLSTGADVLVQVAGQRADLQAVVADGTAAGSFEDMRGVCRASRP